MIYYVHFHNYISKYSLGPRLSTYLKILVDFVGYFEFVGGPIESKMINHINILRSYDSSITLNRQFLSYHYVRSRRLTLAGFKLNFLKIYSELKFTFKIPGQNLLPNISQHRGSARMGSQFSKLMVFPLKIKAIIYSLRLFLNFL